MQRNRRRAAARPTFVKFLRARLAAALPTRSRSEPSALKPGCCAVAKQSKPRWGFEAHERARFAGWRRSLCAAKRALSEVAGTFSVPFGSPKGTPNGNMPLKRVKRRKVARNESLPQKQRKNSKNPPFRILMQENEYSEKGDFLCVGSQGRSGGTRG